MDVIIMFLKGYFHEDVFIKQTQVSCYQIDIELSLDYPQWVSRGIRGDDVASGSRREHRYTTPAATRFQVTRLSLPAPTPPISLVKHIFRAHMLKLLLVRWRRRPEVDRRRRRPESCWRRMAKQTPPMESSRREEKDGVEIGGWRRRGSPETNRQGGGGVSLS
ncbi:hypothetical protein E3N88_38308 [Mikania micrantha]|uniref:Uncharacterized protein n=1 Tax=Mikania micrantha TaxID=192012 RepID=A0A5N6LTL3_9ASTR|nr:hypothetical protein E3N88_38308 [Mikania micrantha]